MNCPRCGLPEVTPNDDPTRMAYWSCGSDGPLQDSEEFSQSPACQRICKLQAELAESRRVTTSNNCEAVVFRLRERAKFGLQKYGVTLDREDLTPAQWIQHAQEEAMDLACYLEGIKKLLGHRCHFCGDEMPPHSSKMSCRKCYKQRLEEK